MNISYCVILVNPKFEMVFCIRCWKSNRLLFRWNLWPPE